MMSMMSTSRLKALLTLSALAIAGCQGENPLGVQGGRVQFVLSSSEAPAAAGAALAPAATGDGDRWRHPFFTSANVTFSSILARNTSGQLVDAQMDLPAVIDVVALEEGGRTVTLPDGDLPPATYDQIVVVMTGVEGVLRDGTRLTVTPPGGGWTAIIPVCPFEVSEDATAVVGLVLPVRNAFAWNNGRMQFTPRFRPRFRCDELPEPEEDETV
jgi:hypothetical protein